MAGENILKSVLSRRNIIKASALASMAISLGSISMLNLLYLPQARAEEKGKTAASEPLIQDNSQNLENLSNLSKELKASDWSAGTLYLMTRPFKARVAFTATGAQQKGQ